MADKLDLRHILSPLARMTRSGSSLGTPKGMKGASVRTAMSTLRAKLDEIEADRESSPRERRRDAVDAINAARTALRGERSRVDGERERLVILADKVHTAVRRAENGVSQFELERMRRLAPALEASDDPGADFTAALRARDISRVLLHAIAFPASDRARAGLAVLLEPQAFCQYADSARDTYQAAGALAALDKGLAELAEHETPWSDSLQASPETVLECSANPLAFAGIDPQSLVPADAPAFLRDRAVPTTQSPADNVTPETAWGPGESMAAAVATAELDGDQIGGAA